MPLIPTHIVLPANVTLTHGFGTFNATATSSATFKITAVDTSKGSVHGTSNTITSSP